MRQVAGTLRLELAQYREKAAFAQFGSDLDAATQKQLARGQRLTEILKQGQYMPMSVERQVLIIFAGTHGYLDKHPVEKLREYEERLSAFVEKKFPEIFQEIIKTGKIEDALKSKLDQALKDFESVFVSS
jgi:F-type H+-transporting ATPase subunit alpha